MKRQTLREISQDLFFLGHAVVETTNVYFLLDEEEGDVDDAADRVAVDEAEDGRR